MSSSKTSLLLKVFGVIVTLSALLFLAYSTLNQLFLKSGLLGSFAHPANLGPAGVKKGEGFVTTSLLIQDDRLGKVMDITPDRQDPSLIWLAGQQNMLSIRPNGQVVSAVPVPVTGWQYRWLDLDNKTALMNVGSWTNPSFLLGPDGNIVWSYGVEGGIDSMAACFNILGDNKTEFVVGFNGSKGIHLLDETGKLVWQVPEKNVWHVEAEDLNDDGKVKIVNSNAAGQLVVRNPDGSLLAQYKPPV